MKRIRAFALFLVLCLLLSACGGTQTPLEIYPYNDGYDYEKDYGSRYASFTPPECTFTPPNGKVFSGWSGAEEFLNYLRVTGSTTLTAQWADAPAGVYTVAYTLTGCTFTGKTNTEAGRDYVTRLVPSGEPQCPPQGSGYPRAHHPEL